jgi:hypothetical protein
MNPAPPVTKNAERLAELDKSAHRLKKRIGYTLHLFDGESAVEWQAENAP